MYALWISVMILANAFSFQNSSPVTKGKFPEISAHALSGEAKKIPVDGATQLLVVAFEQGAQPQADQWFKVYQENFSGKGVEFYELPMISSFWKWMSGFIDRGMRSGIPKEKHGNVITYYGPLESYFKAMGVKDKSLVYVFLVNGEGEILQKAIGFPDKEKVEKLKSVF